MSPLPKASYFPHCQKPKGKKRRKNNPQWFGFDWAPKPLELIITIVFSRSNVVGILWKWSMTSSTVHVNAYVQCPLHQVQSIGTFWRMSLVFIRLKRMFWSKKCQHWPFRDWFTAHKHCSFIQMFAKRITRCFCSALWFQVVHCRWQKSTKANRKKRRQNKKKWSKKNVGLKRPFLWVVRFLITQF